MTEPPDQLTRGLIDRYRFERELGQGGMATVYLAHDLRHQRKVAVKVLRADIARALGPERFLREIALTANLQHPNILPLFDSGATDGFLWYVMPYVAGESLRQRLDREGTLPPAEAGRLAREVADALAHAHQAGIIHRDIKPANILLSGDHALVADFGVAHAAAVSEGRALTGTGVVLGTPIYMSPEQAVGLQNLTPASDVYAVGCVLYEMLTGHPLASGASPGELLTSKLSPDTTMSGVPARLVRVIRRAVSLNPAQRFATAEEFGSAVAEALELESPAGARATRSARRGRWLAAVGVGAAMVVAFVGWQLLKARSRREWALRSLQEVERLAQAHDMLAAFNLARRVETVIPGDSTLMAVWPRLSTVLPVRTEPSGALVYRKAWSIANQAWDRDWELLGTTPLDSIRFGWTGYRLKLEKLGYRGVDLVLDGAAAAEAPAAAALTGPIRLDREDSLPTEQLRAPGFADPTPKTAEVTKDSTRYGDFFVDRFEVTNGQYQAFVDSGGYRRREFWTHEFSREGRQLAWQDAMALLVDRTGRPGPSTWSLGKYPAGQGDYPVGGVSWYEAEAYAAFMGKALPTVTHWFKANAIKNLSAFVQPISNLNGSGPRPVGASGAVNGIGAVDMVGNVREWVYNEDREVRWILGGGWNDGDLAGLGSLAPFDRSPENGLRLFRYVDDSATMAIARAPLAPGWERTRDYSGERPALDGVFRALLSAYQYDRTPLRPRVEKADTASNWIRQRVTFTSAEGTDRAILFLYLPKGGAPPYQTVVYFPGSPALNRRSPDEEPTALFDFLLQAGRAVALPAYKGTYDRDDAQFSITEASALSTFSSASYRDLVVAWSKDLQRSVEYLVTRADIDSSRIGFYGFSWGGLLAPIMLVTEPRLKVAVLYIGGLLGQRPRPEADEFNFLPRVRVPVLLLNGRYDQVFELHRLQEPFFRLLGTPAADKKHLVYPGGHWVPPDILMRESLAWLDQYFGKPAQRGR